MYTLHFLIGTTGTGTLLVYYSLSSTRPVIIKPRFELNVFIRNHISLALLTRACLFMMRSAPRRIIAPA